MMTIGANVLAILLVPKGWIRKMRTRMPQETPTTVELEMLGFTTVTLISN
jgi:hypothetical protein